MLSCFWKMEIIILITWYSWLIGNDNHSLLIKKRLNLGHISWILWILIAFWINFPTNNEYYHAWKTLYESKLILKFHPSNIKLPVHSDNEFMKNPWISWYQYESICIYIKNMKKTEEQFMLCLILVPWTWTHLT